METREFKGDIRCDNGHRFFYVADWQAEGPREWIAYVIRNTDDLWRNPREHYRIKVSGPTVLLPQTTADDIAQQIKGLLVEFLDRNQEVWDLSQAAAWVGETLSQR